MNAHICYLKYVLRHKGYVFVECCRQGIPIRGILHDLSKIRPSEWIPYAHYFYPDHGNVPPRDKTGYYKPTDTGDCAFDFAWLLHQKRNDHHWQWWVLPEDSGGVKVLPMSESARIEMLCDWKGAGIAQGHISPRDDPWKETRDWYYANKSKMTLHPDTQIWVEAVLAIEDPLT